MSRSALTRAVGLREEKEGIFHTLCTSCADASRAARGYLIGVKQTLSLKRCLHKRAGVNTAALRSERQIKARQELDGVWARMRTELRVSRSVRRVFASVNGASKTVGRRDLNSAASRGLQIDCEAGRVVPGRRCCCAIRSHRRLESCDPICFRTPDQPCSYSR